MVAIASVLQPLLGVLLDIVLSEPLFLFSSLHLTQAHIGKANAAFRYMFKRKKMSKKE